MDALQGAVPVPELEIVVHRLFRRQILVQRLPLAAGPQHVKIPFNTSRTFTDRLRPPCRPGGIMGATIAHRYQIIY